MIFILQSPSWAETSATSPTVVSSASKVERVFTSLMRDINGSLGFSISGGKGKEQFIEGDDSIYISKVAEAGPAHRDGKILIGDRLVQVSHPWAGEDLSLKIDEHGQTKWICILEL